MAQLRFLFVMVVVAIFFMSCFIDETSAKKQKGARKPAKGTKKPKWNDPPAVTSFPLPGTAIPLPSPGPPTVFIDFPPEGVISGGNGSGDPVLGPFKCDGTVVCKCKKEGKRKATKKPKKGRGTWNGSSEE